MRAHQLVLALCLCFGAALCRAAEFPAWYLDGAVPRPDPAIQRVDSAEFERWAAAQPPDAKPIVDFVRKHLKRISQAEFEAELYKAYEKLRAVKDGRPPLFITFRTMADDVKSGVWTTALLREKYPKDFEGAAHLNLPLQSGTDPDWAKLDEMAKGRRVLIVEDATVTGRQLTDGAFQVCRRVGDVDVVVPFATKAVREHLESGKLPVRLHTTTEIETVMEQIAKLPSRERDILNRLRGIGVFGETQTLTYFDHKVLDFFSFPNWIREGYLLERIHGVFRPLNLANLAQTGRQGPPVEMHFLLPGREPYRPFNCLGLAESAL